MTSALDRCSHCKLSKLKSLEKHDETTIASLQALSKSLPKSIWHTNDPAPPELRSDISRIIAGGDEEVKVIKDAISLLGTALKELYHARDRIQSFTRKHKSLVSPLRTLPSEILSEIFMHVVDPRVGRMRLYLDTYQSLDVHKGVWTLTRVCSRWRRLAQSDCRLWTRVDINAKSLARSRNPVPILEAYLSRSANLSLTIDCALSSYPAYIPAPSAAAGVIRLLWEVAKRWRKATFNFGDCDPRVWADVKQSTYDRLEDIQIRFGRSIPPDAAVSLKVAPRLRRCSFNQVLPVPPNVRLPIEQLTHYVGPCRIGQIDVLPYLLGSEHLSLTDYGSGPLVHLPRLRRLSIKVANIADRLEAPVLEELSAFHLVNGMHAIVDMLRRSACDSLTLLQTSFIHFPLTAILDILQLSPRMRDLRIAVQPPDAPKADDFFRRMILPEDGGASEEAVPPPRLAPDLETITYAFYGDGPHAPQAFITFLKSRMARENPVLKDASLLLGDKRYHEKSPALQRSVKELASAGLKLRISDVHLAHISAVDV
ncbi:hypothetical protein BD626DRAFT_625850 [Schizophyllum amplum]|uniref:F-box domain-containing protein n=1 Tax=Schizophyllum amplum TaxID=97359 RepID=A0A550CRK8_9AGAR|nr:hypothetical protein BD626DRAFT_625850 [Auriculariopsis ampla]